MSEYETIKILNATSSFPHWEDGMSDWECYPFAGDPRVITVRPRKGRVPCWFHRLMHRWLLGFVWKRKPAPSGGEGGE
jgi:hypothetical protein